MNKRELDSKITEICNLASDIQLDFKDLEMKVKKLERLTEEIPEADEIEWKNDE